MRPRALPALALLAIVVALVIPIIPAHAQSEEVVVLKTLAFDEAKHYMLDLSTKKLLPVNTSYVQVLSYELRDLNASDSYVPVIVLDALSPVKSNGTVTAYAWVLRSVYGPALIVGVADVVNDTVKNLRFFKLSPVSGDVAIVRTSSDVVIYYGHFKLSIPLANYSDPKVLIYTDSRVSMQSLNLIQLRALTQPPNGFRVIREGRGETTFTISASGRVTVWFDESHDDADADLFVFDQNDPHFAQASHTVSWLQLQTWCFQSPRTCAWIYADVRPETKSIDAHGQLKFVVKYFTRYHGGDASWRIAISLGSSSTQTQTPSQTQPAQTTSASPSPAPISERGLLARVESALSNTHTILIIIAILFFILLLVAILRR